MSLGVGCRVYENKGKQVSFCETPLSIVMGYIIYICDNRRSIIMTVCQQRVQVGST